MFNFIASLFGYIMKFIYDLVQNYGLAIILFTFLIKIILIPLTIKQQKSLEKTQELQPLMQELQRKYGNDQQRFALEYQKLLKEKNMSMASGMGCTSCLLQLLQFPIIIGLFYMMANPLTHILKLPAEEIDKYEQNLNTYYAEQAIEEAQKQAEISGETLTSGEIAEIYSGDYLNGYRYTELVVADQENLFNMDFLGINLGDIASQARTNYVLYIIPALCVIVTLVSLQLSSAETKKMQEQMKSSQKDENGEEIPMPNMAVMNIMMPFLTGYIAFIAPQGLGLYWTVNNLLQLIQMFVIRIIKKNKEKKSTGIIQ